MKVGGGSAKGILRLAAAGKLKLEIARRGRGDGRRRRVGLFAGVVVVDSLARWNYTQATAAAAAGEGSDSANAAAMRAYGFIGCTGDEVEEPSRFEKVQALVISL